jgi:hypothetical protein
MAVPAPDLRHLTDDQIWDQLHGGMVDSDLHRQCVLQMRNSQRQAEAGQQLVQATGALVDATRRLAGATWALASMTGVLVLAAAAQVYAMFRWHA